MEQKLISIVIPVYNGEPFLHSLFDSLRLQTYSYWEAVCVNDGSKDNSLRILEDMSRLDKRFRIINQSNQGAAKARETGITECQGEYITFLDVDDNFCTETFSDVIAQFSDNVDIVSFGMNLIENGKVIRTTAEGNGEFEKIEYLRHVMTNAGWSLCGKVFRRCLFQDSIITRADIRLGEDAFVFFQLAERARTIKIVNRNYYNYIQVSSSAMHSYSRDFADETLLAGYYIYSFFASSAHFNELRDQLSAMMLLLYSSSTFNGRARIDTTQMKVLREQCFTRRALKLLPPLKALNVILNLASNGLFSLFMRKLNVK